MKKNDFDILAPVYDRLSKIVFGKSIVNSQKYFLNQIPDGASILILGGGTGELLPELFKNKDKIRVCYVEASAKMISQAKKRVYAKNTVQFICGTEDDIPTHQPFDAVITNFYLDLFSHQSLKIALTKIKKSTAPKTLWIVTDFVDDSFWQIIMLKIMYLFFRITCNIEASELPNWRGAMRELGGTEKRKKFFYRKFIQSVAVQF